MQASTNLEGNIKQLTLHGQLSFILGNPYQVRTTKDRKVVTASGEFGIVGSDETIDATIEIEKDELVDYVVL